MIFKKELEIYVDGKENQFCASKGIFKNKQEKCKYLRFRGFCDTLNVYFGVCHLFGCELRFNKKQHSFIRPQKCTKTFKIIQ